MRGVWVFHAFGLVILSGLGGVTPAWALDDRRTPGTPAETTMERAFRRASEVETETQRKLGPGSQHTVQRKIEAAIPDHPSKRLEVGLGLILLDSLRSGRDASDGTSSMLSMRPLLSLNGAWLVSDEWWLGGILAYQPLQVQSEDGFASSRATLFQTYVGTDWAGWDFRCGMGLLNYSVSGKGGTTTQSNADATTTFALPSTAVTSRLFLLTLGTGKRAGKWVANLDAQLSNPLSGKRAADLLLTVGVDLW
jgi:hypothetical protein